MLSVGEMLRSFTIVLVIGAIVSKAAYLPDTGSSNSTETTAMAKSSTSIMDVFDDTRWFFERLSIFCDMVEKLLPPVKKEVEQPQPSVGINLQTGLRHFIFGVREISKSIVRVLSDKEVREYKQLSRATDFAHDLVKSVGDFFHNLRIIIGNLFATYTFYIPEVLLSKCMGNYLLQTYPHRPLYEYPVLLVNDIIDSFRTPIIYDDGLPRNASESDRMLGSGASINFDKNVEQNEILDEDMYVFHNNPISPSPELAVAKPDQEPTTTEPPAIEVDAVIEDHFGLKNIPHIVVPEILSWKKCVQIYATETIFRKLEFYFLEVRQ